MHIYLKNISKVKTVFLTFLTVFCVFLLPVYAQASQNSNNFLYKKPTTEELARMYWAINRLDIDNTVHLDNFMLITECGIYKRYYNHEFEWKKIRTSLKDFIRQNQNKFPLRFQFTQEIRLGEYDIQRQKFKIFRDYIIEPTRRFQVIASDYSEDVCGLDGFFIEGYPRALMLELSRPFTINQFPLDKDTANRYISEKLQAMQSSSPFINKANRDKAYEARDAYLVMKVKIFSAAEPDLWRTGRGEMITHVLGVLEGYEIYSDKDLQNLIYVEDFIKERNRSPLELQYIAEYQKEKAEHERFKNKPPKTNDSKEPSPSSSNSTE